MKKVAFPKRWYRWLSVILVIFMLFAMAPSVYAGNSYTAESVSDNLNGWEFEDGYSVTGTWVYEGSYALEHTGSTSKAVSDKIYLESGITYFVEAFVRPTDQNASVSLDFAGQNLHSTGYGNWEKLDVVVRGNGKDEQITITATGLTQIDGITVRPFKEGENLLTNGDMSNSAVPFGGGQWLDEFEGAQGVLKQPASGGIVRGSRSISVEKGTFYLVSIDVYMEENPNWAYVDMEDRAGEVQLRGTVVGEWHNVSAIWEADASTVPLRMVVESNWDNPNGGTGGTGAVYFDNISIKQITFFDDLVTDEGFEKSNQTDTWLLGDGASITSNTYYLFGKHSLQLTDSGYAVANNGQSIQVEPNCYYYYSAWRFRSGNRDTDGRIVIRRADNQRELASITGSRYNQTMWNPAEGTNFAEKQTGHWEQIYGIWFSGDNTSIKLYAESNGPDPIYFDNVTFNKYENRAVQANIFENGDMDGYIPDEEDLKPTDQEKARVKAQYESFLANNLENFPTSFKIGGKQYYGFGTDFTLTNQTIEQVYRAAVGKNVGVKTISTLTHKSGLVFTVESVLYENYNAYDWTLYAEQPATASGKSSVISNWKAIDFSWFGEAPKLTGSIGDHAAYEPYTAYLDGKLRKSSESGRGTSGDSSYFNFQYGDKGIMMAVGWPGYWELELDNSKDASTTRMTAGQVQLNTYLNPGETIRTPLMAFVHYNGRNDDRSTNLWRSWMIDCNMNTITSDAEGNGEEKLPEAGIYAATSIQWHEMTRATTKNQIDAISYYLKNNINLTYWWMDAGWYYKLDSKGNFQTLNDGVWADTGTWVVDAERFKCLHEGETHAPLFDISAFAEENGIRTLLWFEPERIANKSMLVDDATDRTHFSDNTTIHPSWVLEQGYSPILDMGNEDAVSWMLNRILTVMTEGGIDMYREDFNTDPLPNWVAADKAKDAAGNRTGVTENLYIQGHLGMWDSILEAIPNATIDSCASGGNRNDLETMRRAVPLHKTDHAYGDQTWQQNAEAFLQKWIPYVGTKANGETEIDDNTTTANRYSLRTALVGGMVLGYDTDSEKAPVDWDIIEDITEEHKSIMHLLYSDYYVLEKWSSSGNDWAAWEYFDNELNEGYVIAFRRENASTAKTYYLKGLEKNTYYKIWFEDANKPVIRTGLDLMKNGVVFAVPVANGSDILHIQKATEAEENRSLTTIISQVSVNGQYHGAICQINAAKGDTMIEALKTENANYTRFDIHFNMSLRDTLLENGTVEYSVENDYKDLFTIDGQKVSALLSRDASAVYMNYDALNNILNVYVKDSLFDKNADHEVIMANTLRANGGAVIEGETTWNYSSSNDEWTKGSVGNSLANAVSLKGFDVMLVGSTQMLNATVTPLGAENKQVTWTTSDDTVATVDQTGLVTARKAGKVIITATSTDETRVEGRITISIEEPSDQIRLNGQHEMSVGTKQTLTVTLGADFDTDIVWSTSNEELATVDNNGQVSALKEGSVIVRAASKTDPAVFAEFEITVKTANTSGAGIPFIIGGSVLLLAGIAVAFVLIRKKRLTH